MVNLDIAAALSVSFLEKYAPAQAHHSRPVWMRSRYSSSPNLGQLRGWAGAESPQPLYFAVRDEELGVIAIRLNRVLAFTSVFLSNLLRSQKRMQDALAYALQAELIFRELREDTPDEFALAHAHSVLEVRLCLATEPQQADQQELAEWLESQLPEAVRLLYAESARRRDIDGLQQNLAMLLAIARESPSQDQLATLDELTTNAVDHLRAGALPEALLMLRYAEAFAREVHRSATAGVALCRVLNSLALAEEQAGLDTALGTAREAFAIALELFSAPDADQQETARVLATAAQGLANRLATAGRADDAFEARQKSLDALAMVYDRRRPDDVWTTVALLSVLMKDAESRGNLTKIPQESFVFATDVLEGFTTHRDMVRLPGLLASVGFLTVTALARRNDSEATARALDAVAALAHRLPGEATIVSAMVLSPLNAIGCYLRAHRLDLADAALAALAGLVDEHPENVEARLQLAKCGNQLVNAYVDLDLAKAAAVIGVAGPALRSDEYLAILPSLGEDDPPGYLEWLTQIEAAGQTPGVTGSHIGPLSPEELEVAVADYRSTTTQRDAELGVSHPLTIATRLRLAILLEQAGDAATAAEEARKAYESSFEVLGPSDVTTIDALEVWRRCAPT